MTKSSAHTRFDFGTWEQPKAEAKKGHNSPINCMETKLHRLKHRSPAHESITPSLQSKIDCPCTEIRAENATVIRSCAELKAYMIRW